VEKEMRSSKGWIVQIAVCLVMLGGFLFSYLEKQNELTQIRIYVPKLVKEIRNIREESVQLSYQIQAFESPEHLMKLASDPQFSHLKYPLSKDILVLQETPFIENVYACKTNVVPSKIKHTLAVGAK
jgi:hypothetical protein